MKTFNEKLLEAQKEFEVQKYKKHAMPEVLAYYKLWHTEHPGQFCYNAMLVDYIKAHEDVSNDTDNHLGTEVYLAAHDVREEKHLQRDAEMFNAGYQKISPDVEYRGKIEVQAVQTSDWFTNKVAITGKLITDGRGAPFFVPKGKRTRGYRFDGFNFIGYFKPIYVK